MGGRKVIENLVEKRRRIKKRHFALHFWAKNNLNQQN